MSRLQALLTGLLSFVVLHLIILHLFVLWKWQSSPEIDELFVQIEYSDEVEIPAIGDAVPGVPHRASLDALKLESQVSLSTAFPQEQASNTLAKYHLKLMEWDTDHRLRAAIQEFVVLPDGNATISNLTLADLLLRESLSEIHEEKSLQSTLEAALTELEDLLKQSENVQWSKIGALLRPSNPEHPFPPKEKLDFDTIYQMVCALETEEEQRLPESATTSSSLAENQDMELYAQEDELDQQFAELHGRIEQRRESILEYLKNARFVSLRMKELSRVLIEDLRESKTLIHNEIEEIVTHFQEYEAAADDDENEAENRLGQCIQEEHILALVEEGLNTLNRRGDLRSALLRKLREIDPPSADNLILDAVLETRSPIPEIKLAQTINARRLLDKPLLKHMVVGMDWISDWIRNYTDLMDNFVNQLALATGHTDRASSGEIIVTRLLQITGAIQVPVPTKKAKELLARSKLGRDLLTAS